MCSIAWHRFPGRAWMTPDGNSARRKALKEMDALPAISEIKARLGSPMANIFFQSMADYTSAMEQLGLDEPLVGPTENLWVSPSDVMGGKVLLSVPHTPRCLQSLTHQAVLYMGKQYEQEVEKETLRRIQDAVAKVTQVLTNEKEEAVEEAIATTREYEQKKYEHLLQQLKKEIDELVKKTTDDLEKRLLKEAQADKEKTLTNLHESMERQIACAVEEKEKYLIKKFNFRLMWEGNKYYEYYRDKIFEQQKKWSAMFEEARILFCKEIKKINTEKEAKHITDLMKIYHEAATKINKIKETTERELKLCLEEKDKYLQPKDVHVEDNLEQIQCKDGKIKLLKNKIIELTDNFQEFIQFTMQDRPSQTQYLLSLQQILKDDISCEDKDMIPLQPSDSRENVEVVIAIIFDIIMKHYCKKNEITNSEEETTSVRTPVSKTFEERVEHERAANKAIDLIITGINSEKKDKVTKENLDNLVERVETVKEILTYNPSIYKLFKNTKSAIKKRKQDCQHQSLSENDSTEISELRVCQPCNVNQRYIIGKESECITDFKETTASENQVTIGQKKTSRCTSLYAKTKKSQSSSKRHSNGGQRQFVASYSDSNARQPQSGSSQRKSSTQQQKLNNVQLHTNKNQRKPSIKPKK